MCGQEGSSQDPCEDTMELGYWPPDEDRIRSCSSAVTAHRPGKRQSFGPHLGIL